MKSKIDLPFQTHSCTRIFQGDILRDISFQYLLKKNEVQEFTFPYAIVISQDCDLEQFQSKLCEISEGEIFNQFLPNLLIIPAFPDESLREGNHILDLYNFKHTKINSDPWKIVKSNRNDRYHYITGNIDMQIPNLVCDFKHFFTIGFDLINEQYKEVYLATVSELFRERLSQRFSNYLSRIGLPEFGR